MAQAAALDYTEYVDTKELAQAYPHFFTVPRLHDYAKKRTRNGLEASGAITVSPTGKLYWHQTKTVRWYLGQPTG